MCAIAKTFCLKKQLIKKYLKYKIKLHNIIYIVALAHGCNNIKL